MQLGAAVFSLLQPIVMKHNMAPQQLHKGEKQTSRNAENFDELLLVLFVAQDYFPPLSGNPYTSRLPLT
jgi:hypothetical protein